MLTEGGFFGHEPELRALQRELDRPLVRLGPLAGDSSESAFLRREVRDLEHALRLSAMRAEALAARNGQLITALAAASTAQRALATELAAVDSGAQQGRLEPRPRPEPRAHGAPLGAGAQDAGAAMSERSEEREERSARAEPGAAGGGCRAPARGGGGRPARTRAGGRGGACLLARAGGARRPAGGWAGRRGMMMELTPGACARASADRLQCFDDGKVSGLLHTGPVRTVCCLQAGSAHVTMNSHSSDLTTLSTGAWACATAAACGTACGQL